MKESAENKTLQKQEQGSENLFGAAHEAHCPASAFPDDRPESKQLKAIQSGVNASPQVQQFKAIQQMASQRGGTPSTGLSAQPVNDRGLPAQLQAGLESLSGMDLSDVQVHRNSNKPAQVGALAYAQGNDIHLAAGQEHHLPHEAWHVVQQRQGRVQATTKAENGTPVNDDKGLEAEADVMGGKAAAMRGETGGELQKASAAAPLLQKKAMTGNAVVQRIVSSVVPKIETKKTEEGTKNYYSIAKVVVIGRPQKLFGNSMGDHTTAFSVHAEGLQQQLANKSFAEGFKILQKFYDDTKELPGYKLFETSKKENEEKKKLIKGEDKIEIEEEIDKRKKRLPQLDRLVKAEECLTKLLTAKDEDQSPEQVHHFQETVNAFLEFRELVPLSAINVMAVAPALAGKGKAEGTHIQVLREHSEKTKGVDVINAVKGLFDAKSIAIALTELDAGISEMICGGMGQMKSKKDKIQNFICQHILSVKTAFPNVIPNKNAEEVIWKALEKDLNDQIVARIDHLINDKIQKLPQKYANLLNISESKNSKKGANEVKACEEAIFLFNQQADQLFSLFLASTNNDHKRKEEYWELVTHGMALVWGDLVRTSKKVKKFDFSEFDKKVKSKETVNEENEKQNSKDKVEKGITEEEKNLEKEEKDSPLGVQIIPLDGKVSDVKFGGRPTSPFGSKSMGAHTTAWTVHIDIIRNLTSNKKFGEAIAIIQDPQKGLIADALRMEEQRKQQNIPIEEEQKDALAGAKFKAIMLLAEKKPQDELGQMLFLSYAIGIYLSYVNVIPGTTMLTGKNNDGKSEAKHRKTLLDYEKSENDTQKSLQEAIHGLYDRPELKHNAQSDLMEDQHFDHIRLAYPKSFAKAYPGHKPKSKPNTKVDSINILQFLDADWVIMTSKEIEKFNDRESEIDDKEMMEIKTHKNSNTNYHSTKRKPNTSENSEINSKQQHFLVPGLQNRSLENQKLTKPLVILVGNPNELEAKKLEFIKGAIDTEISTWGKMK